MGDEHGWITVLNFIWVATIWESNRSYTFSHKAFIFQYLTCVCVCVCQCVSVCVCTPCTFSWLLRNIHHGRLCWQTNLWPLKYKFIFAHALLRWKWLFLNRYKLLSSPGLCTALPPWKISFTIFLELTVGVAKWNLLINHLISPNLSTVMVSGLPSKAVLFFTGLCNVCPETQCRFFCQLIVLFWKYLIGVISFLGRKPGGNPFTVVSLSSS